MAPARGPGDGCLWLAFAPDIECVDGGASLWQEYALWTRDLPTAHGLVQLRVLRAAGGSPQRPQRILLKAP